MAIEHKAYARVGLLGNPSDAYWGRTISFSLANFWASVQLRPSDDLLIRPHPTHDLLAFPSPRHLVSSVAHSILLSRISMRLRLRLIPSSIRCTAWTPRATTAGPACSWPCAESSSSTARSTISIWRRATSLSPMTPTFLVRSASLLLHARFSVQA